MVESIIVAVRVAARDAWNFMASISTTELSMIDWNVISLITGYRLYLQWYYRVKYNMWRELNNAVQGLSFLRNKRKKCFLVPLVEYFGPLRSSFSLNVFSDFPSVVLVDLCATVHHLSLLFHFSHSLTRQILLIIKVVSSEWCFPTNNFLHLSYLEVTGGIQENGKNLLGGVCATQPIGKFLRSPSCPSTLLYSFDILS